MYIVNTRPINHTSPHARAKRIRGFLNTFRLLPDELIMAVVLEDLNLSDDTQDCLLGRMKRLSMDFFDIEYRWMTVPEFFAEHYGGELRDWYRIYRGVFTPDHIDPIEGKARLDELGHGFEDEIELAFTKRLDEAVRDYQTPNTPDWKIA
jgi:hypothetical protein